MKRWINSILALAMLAGLFIPAFNLTASAATEQYNHYYGLLHAHTSNSDGVGTYEDAYNMARGAGLDFFACTEHAEHFDTAKSPGNLAKGGGVNGERWKNGLAVADKLTENGKFVAIMAYEMTWPAPDPGQSFGHINTFNTTGYVSTNNPHYALDGGKGPQNYYDDLAADKGAISQFNHPSAAEMPRVGFFGNFNQFGYWTPERDKAVSLIEIGNGDSRTLLFDLPRYLSTGVLSPYLRFESSYNLALSKGWHVGPTNNQDNHNANWGIANDFRTVLLATELTRPALYDAMTNRRVYATEDKNMRVDFTINGEVMGSILDYSPKELQVSVKASNSNANIARIELVTEGGKVVRSKTIRSKTAQWDFTIPADYKYYYIKMESSFTFTAPIWVKENCSVTFDAGNGEANTTATVKYGDTVAMPKNPVKEDYTFQGWYTETKRGEKPFDFNAGIKADTVLKAGWKKG